MPAELLDREEYVEQAYFFRAYRERLADAVPSQEILAQVREELLSNTRLPVALEVIEGELLLRGQLVDGMQHLGHYFTPFQIFVIGQSEDEKAKFDQYTALHVLEKEAEYRAEEPTPQGLFIYHFEAISRNHLGYDRGLEAVAADPIYTEEFRDWILRIRTELGTIDFADMIYVRSEQVVVDQRRQRGIDDWEAGYPILFGAKEGRIAKANRSKDPLYMFAALQRQLHYPEVPRTPKAQEVELDPVLERRLVIIEKRLQLAEAELKGGVDLTEFYASSDDGLTPLDQ
ncbi:MAG TPA: hypothetical protein DCE47_01270 [Planctomycetaceae bacterium]|nr:hypothetical protein [Planctomycetaceae bacterium]HCD00963.1 hypothetical protein [Planctomycetaceae bacterium]|tara:strand:+ start:1325 stop:2185 length:861 start_codon:yes stop_codon:yes gene_type:complete